MPKSKVAVIDATIILIGLAVLIGLGLTWWAPWRPVLIVWSCGGNYESLCDYSRWFEQKYNCRVRYTGAPIQYLLELAADPEAPVDVLVGRGGPGWKVLYQRGRLGRGPVFFGVDPFVIATPKGNPAQIQDIKDLGEPGVRLTYSPLAMRPRGKCISHLMVSVSDKFYPGLVERWINNSVVKVKCGRKLLDPVVDGRVDAVIVPRSTTTWPEVQGKIEVIPIGPKYHDAMKSCRAVPPQCCGVLSTTSNPQLANAYVDGIISQEGQAIFAKRGYLPIDSPQAQAYSALLQVFIPQNMPAWQMHMAQRLYDDAAYGSALRRCFQIIGLFGPSHYDARARYYAGLAARGLGKDDVARLEWQRLVREFPRKGKLEWERGILQVGEPIPDVEEMPEEHWVQLARDGLKELGDTRSLSAEHHRWLAAFPPERVRLWEGYAGKSGRRWFAVAEDSLAAGQYVAATREYLKVLTLSYPSSYMAAARFRVALCDYLRGYVTDAIAQWQQLAAELPDDEWGRAAARALKMADGAQDTASDAPPAVSVPEWTYAYDTDQQRGMSYGMALFEHHMPLYALKEMVKISQGIYKKPGKMLPEARFKAGVCCLAMGKAEAAAMQWQMCQAH